MQGGGYENMLVSGNGVAQFVRVNLAPRPFPAIRATARIDCPSGISIAPAFAKGASHV